jgi:hypothetical protein
MTATNHAMTGALIGLVIGQPLIAIPAAVVSHFVCDALPHFRAGDTKEGFEDAVKAPWFTKYLITEAFLCALIVLVLAAVRPENWLLAAVCAFAAAAPDFLWVPKYLQRRSEHEWQPNRFGRFAAGIQWFQKPIGALVEIAWFIGCAILILPFLRAA